MKNFATQLKHLVSYSAFLLIVATSGCDLDLGTPPTVTFTDPANNETGVPINQAVSVTFSTPMSPSSITGTSFTLTQGSTPVSGVVTYSGVTATFTPTNNLTPNVVYTATISTEAEDLADNELAAAYSFSFTTGTTADIIAPTVTFTDPGANDTGVPLNQSIAAGFSKSMDPSTINNSTFTLMQGTTPVSGVVTYSGVTAVFTPTNNLAANTLYAATITTGARDLNGNALAANYTWTFTTGTALHTSQPTVVSTNPLNGATATSINQPVSATFSETMDALTINNITFTLKQGSVLVSGTVIYEGLTATFTPTANLAPNTTYSAMITTGAKDLAGNGLANNYVWSFTTGIASGSTGPAPVSLAGVSAYGVLAGSAITLAGGPNSVTGFRVIGDVGVSPGTACNGCDSTTVSGTVQSTAVAAQAENALTAVYNDAIGRTLNKCTLASSDLTAAQGACGGPIYVPGLYWSGTIISIPVNGTIILDGQNNPNAVFIFQSESSIGSLANSHVVLVNQANPNNVFWVGKSSATIGGIGATFVGTLIMYTSITIDTNTQMLGRALARNGQVTVGGTALITVP
jgi:hypothetical protein